ncbi:peptide/nickel transport system permease protein [Actinopolymorpha pittospori]|uniref:Peptide/nickel transport system permease protein n=1 Tax=Actinopolymorpha pittospori TaxID=648752 RepID=A0A927MZ73_9ACTN|nr:peptide/nickel transport system permease protein [Actinopolymorpha pittospori]
MITAISGHGPYEFNESALNAAAGGIPAGPAGGISADHWFGVEPQKGRDTFARIVYGARVSMLIGISATAVTTVLGVTLGMLAGFFGGRVDQIISRIMDFLMAFPALIFMIAVLSAIPQGNRPMLLVIVLSIFSWTHTARVIRGQTMSLANREFVEAAHASGAGPLTITFKEILPNLSGTVIVMATLAVPRFIATEAGLSFLGVGVTPPTPSWGQMIATAVPWYSADPMFFAIPGMFLFLTVFSFTVLGDNLQQAWATGGRA